MATTSTATTGRIARRTSPLIAVVACAVVSLTATVASFAALAPHTKTTITHFSASTNSTSQFGGLVTFTATIGAGKSCTLSATPTLGGLPFKTSCTKSAYSDSIELPENLTTKTVSYTFKLTATGTTSATASVVVKESSVSTAITSSWSGPTGVQAEHGTPSAVSCASSSMCVFGDDSGYVVVDGQTPQSVDTTAITGISCPSVDFCVAVDNVGDFVTFNGTSWTAPSATGASSLTAVSCSSSSNCVAVDQQGDATTYNGSSWTSPHSVDSISVPDGISCAAAGDCVVVDDAGDAVVESSGSWSSVVNVDSNGLTSVSCASASSCVAADDGGQVAKWDGTSWSSLTDIDGTSDLTGISCVLVASATHCIAVDDSGRAAAYDGTSWSAAASVDAGGNLVAISCASDTSCDAVDVQGNVASLSGSTWSVSAHDRIAAGIDSIACTTVSSCIAMETSGGYFTFNGSSWSSLSISPLSEAEVISCAGAFCAAGGEDGKIVTRTGTHWNSVDTVGSATITAIQCESATFCIAGNILGQDATWNGSSWSGLSTLDVNYGRGFGSVSCLTTSVCVFNDHQQHEAVWRSKSSDFVTEVDSVGGDFSGISCPSKALCWTVDITGYAASISYTASKFKWSSMSRIDASGITAISCASSFYCGAVDQSGDFLQWVNGKWSTPKSIDATPLVALSCSPDGRCTAIDQNDEAVTTVLK